MTKILEILSDHLFISASFGYIVWILLCSIFVRYFDQVVGRWVRKTESKIDDLVLQEAQLPLWLLLIVAGLFVVSRITGLPAVIAGRVDRFSELTIVFVLVYFALKLFLNLVRLNAETNQALKNLVPTLGRFVNLAIGGMSLLIVMDLLGISVTPVLASLGIAGLAVGLALQDTLGNFFAGLYVSINQPVRLGDYIELENGLKGYVERIGWRETRIRTLPNNVIIVPNAKLSQSIITNYYLPERELACLVQVGVSYDSDLEKVEKVTIEVSREVLRSVVGGVKTFEPFIRFHTFADFSINFTVILRVSEFTDQYLLTHEFIKALHKRYKAEGIEIPFPIRTIYQKT